MYYKKFVKTNQKSILLVGQFSLYAFPVTFLVMIKTIEFKILQTYLKLVFSIFVEFYEYLQLNFILIFKHYFNIYNKQLAISTNS